MPAQVDEGAGGAVFEKWPANSCIRVSATGL
jgi:hypothetical protein